MQSQSNSSLQSHVGHGNVNKYGFRPILLNRIIFSFSYRLNWKGKMYIQLKLYHCAFYQYNNYYINSYLDEESVPTLVPIIKGLNQNVGSHGKT